MLLMGACGLAYEYNFSRTASDLLGNTIQQWAIVIALMLFCMGVGAEVQRRVADARLAPWLLGSQILLALLGAFGPLGLVLAFAEFPYHFALLQYGLVGLAGVLIGFEIPMLLRLNEQFRPEMRVNLAQILKMDYVGALVGALVWIFVLHRLLPMATIGYVLGATTLVACLLLWWVLRTELAHPGRWLAALGVGLTVMGVAGVNSPAWVSSAEQALYRDRVILRETTDYQHIVMTESAAGLTNLYINGHLQFSSADEEIYHENLVHPAMHLAPERARILILGGGDGLALREVLKYPGVREVTLVDIDPFITQLARENPTLSAMNQDALRDARVQMLAGAGVTRGEPVEVVARSRTVRPANPSTVPRPQVHLYHLDAAAFVRQFPEIFDVVIIDFPDPNHPDLAKLYSRDFYAHVHKRLAADGILVQQATSPRHAKEAFLSIGRTLEAAGFAVVPLRDNVPTFGEWGWWIGASAARQTSTSLKAQIANIDTFAVPTRYLHPTLMQANLEFGHGQLETPETAITELFSPAVYRYYQRAWQALP